MAREHADVPIERDQGRARVEGVPGPDASLGQLFKQLTADTGELVRQEVALARTEMRQTAAMLARDSAKVGIALGLALAGALALTAFLVSGLGTLLGGRYWLAALIIGVILAGVGVLMARSAFADISRHGIAPEQTVRTLRDDAAWAKEEAREVKREMTT
ncbi:MAG TPA: phage holin family protein [Gemmatimonadaceae bacterium]|nr:phage holin family protein [Gemmatimonadaceae bacterium]